MYDPVTHKYSDAPGVTTRIPGFGDTSSVEYLDPDTKWFEVTQYFYAMVTHFVNKGYTRGKDIVGAPYDWRFSPSKYNANIRGCCSIIPRICVKEPRYKAKDDFVEFQGLLGLPHSYVGN